jgi:nitrate reductase gamma subunit
VSLYDEERRMIDFVQGPLIWISLGVFFLGLLFQWIQFFAVTRKREWKFLPLEAKKEKTGSRWFEEIGRWIHRLTRRTVLGTHPFLIVITSIFHILLFGVPLFLLGHHILLDSALGLSLWSLPESISHALTIVVLFCGLFFLGRRLFLVRVRILTTAYDYLMLLVTMAPFLTGFLAYHQWFDYRTLIFLHILAGEVMLIVIPFTRLGHMIFFFLYRFFIDSEYSFVRGTRTW